MEYNLKKMKINVFLAKPDKTSIGKINNTVGMQYSVKSLETNSLSFTINRFYEVNGEMLLNPIFDLIKEKYLLRVEFKGGTEWMSISSIRRHGESDTAISVTANSLEYQLGKVTLRDFERVSINAIELLEDITKGLVWRVGYINPQFNLMRRSFDVTSQSILSFLLEVVPETYDDSIVIFDTNDMTVNMYEKDELSEYKGFTIRRGHYIKNIEDFIDADEIVTRLYVTGEDGLSINSVNPTGKPYIDDFSYFMYPFDMNEKGEIVSHSDYMSDNLCVALHNYNKTMSDKKDDFSELLKRKTKQEQELTKLEEKLFNLKTELQIILDAIASRKTSGLPTQQLIRDRNKKNKEIKSQEGKVSGKKQEIKNTEKEIEKLKGSLNVDNFLTITNQKELADFIQDDEWSDENKYDPYDLYESALKRMKEINEPPTNITTNIVNFFEMIGEQHNWDRLSLRDIVRVDYGLLNINVKTTITEMVYDFDGHDISITINDTKRAESDMRKIENAIYTVGERIPDFEKRKIKWEKVAYNFNVRNDRNESTPTTPKPVKTPIKHIKNDNGTVNIELKWDFPDFNKTKKDEDNIDGFLVYLYYDKEGTSYQFGTMESREDIITLPLQKKSHVFTSLPSNLYYTIGVRAYRSVDDDINRDGVLLSDFLYLNEENKKNKREILSRTFMPASLVTPLSMDEDGAPPTPYQPENRVDFSNAYFDGVKLGLGGTKPSNPNLGDVWLDKSTNTLLVWDGYEWRHDANYDEIEEQIREQWEALQEWEYRASEQTKLLEDTINAQLEELNEELRQIDDVVMPAVEEAIKTTEVPEQDLPPDEIPLSGMWKDTSESPPRMMRWDEDNMEWIPLAPTREEIQEDMDEIRANAVADSRRYTKLEILETRRRLMNELNEQLGDVHGEIEALLEMKEDLIELADEIDAKLEDYDGHFKDFQLEIDKLDGKILVGIEEIERIGEITTSHTNQIEINSKEIGAKLDSVEYKRDREGLVSDITKNASDIKATAESINMMVTKEEFQKGLDNIETTGKNKISHIASNWEGGKFDGSGQPTGTPNWFRMRRLKKLISEQEYTLSRYRSTKTVNILTYDNKGNFIRRIGESTFTTGSNEVQFKIEMESGFSGASVADIGKTLQVQLEVGNKSTEWEYALEDHGDLITKTNADLNIIAGQIELKADKSELNDKVDVQDYKKDQADLTVAYDKITADVSQTKAQVDKNTGQITSASSDISSLKQTAQGFEREITSIHGEVGDLDKKVDNIRVGGRNLVSNNTLKYSEGVTLDDYVFTFDSKATSLTRLNIRVDGSVFEDDTDYVVTFKARKISGELYRLAGHSTVAQHRTTRLFIDGIEKTSELEMGWSNVGTASFPNDNKVHTYEIRFTTESDISSVDNSDWYIQPNRAQYEDVDYKIEIWDWQVEKGNTATQWTKPQEDYEAEFESISKKFTKVEEEAGRITSKVGEIESKSEEDMKAVYTEINQLPDRWSVDIKQGIGDLEIGGRNLLEDSKSIDMHSNNGRVYPIQDVVYQGHRRLRRIDLGNGDERLSNYTAGFYETKIGEEYTVSIMVKPEKNLVLRLNTRGREILCKKDEWTTLSYTFKATEERTRYYGIYSENAFVDGNPVWIEYKNLKAEKGSKATDWSPAPEDQVGKDEVITSINASMEGVTIQAPKVDIKGVVSFINSDGSSATMINGNKLVTGSVTANEIDATDIFSNRAVIAKIQAGSVKTAKLDATQIDTGTINANRIGAKSITVDKLNVDNIFGNSAVIGKIQALEINAGRITSGTINADRVTISNNKVTINSSGVTVNEADFLIKDGGGVLSLAPKSNLIKDPFFTGVGMNKNVLGEPTDSDFLTYRFLGISGSMYGAWGAIGTPRITNIYWQQGWSELTIFGYASPIVSRNNKLTTAVTLKRNTTYTFSLYHRKAHAYSSGVGRPQLVIQGYNTAFDEATDRQVVGMSPSYNNSYDAERWIITFKTKNFNSKTDMRNMVLEINAETGDGSTWVMVDGIELVEDKYAQTTNFNEGEDSVYIGGRQIYKLRAQELASDSLLMEDSGRTTEGTPVGVVFSNSGGAGGTMDSISSSNGYITLYGNRRDITGDTHRTFRVRSHAEGKSYRDDFYMSASGYPAFPQVYDRTSSNSANLRMSSIGSMFRTSSSIRYKKNVHSLDHDYAIQKLMQLEPVLYNPLSSEYTDTFEDWSHFGLIAEQVAKVEPRLVDYRTHYNSNDSYTDNEPIPLEEPVPESVHYQLLSVMQLPVIQELVRKQRRDEARIAFLENELKERIKREMRDNG